ncbi:HEPN domain-containing protein [Herpetosiphon gulosus]|uniref:Apea-like HEPN domain-containing protein n=1 Tax=Herpetosiphon gulosus TaxID=1973496 RepID=A0ABP9WWP0_9CHLR
MSIDLFLRTKNQPTRRQIEKIIFPLGWKKATYYSGYKGLSYYWFNENNYESTRGCWLFIDYNPVENVPKDTKVVFHAYSNAGRSFADLEAQNNVIKQLKKAFLGSLYNPQEGVCSYLYYEIPEFTVIERGCSIVYRNFINNIITSKIAVQDDIDEFNYKKENLPWMLRFDKGIIINNLIIPYIVSSIEEFLKNFFVIYVNNQESIQKNILKKLDLHSFKNMYTKKVTIGDEYARLTSFQNIPKIISAFNEIEIDIEKILNVNKIFNKKEINIKKVIAKYITIRHKIVHEAFIDIEINKNDILTLIFATENFIDEFKLYMKKNKNIIIDIDEYL